MYAAEVMLLDIEVKRDAVIGIFKLAGHIVETEDSFYDIKPETASACCPVS